MKKFFFTAIFGGLLFVTQAQNLDFHEDFSGLDDSQNTFQGLVNWDLTNISLGNLTGDAVILDAGESSISASVPGGISLFRCEMYSSKSNNSIQVTVLNASNTVLSQNTFSSLKNTTIEVVLPAFTPESGCTLTIENTTNGGGGNKDITIDDVSWMGFPIYDIQYTTDPSGDSPQTGNIVSTSGTVTGVNADGFYLQNTEGSLDGSGAADWSGIFVENTDFLPSLIDYVTVTGTVVESNGRTTIFVNGTSNYDAQITKPLGGNIPTSNLIVGPLQEKDESVFSSIQSSRYTQNDYAEGNYTMTIGFDPTETNNTPIPIDNDLAITNEPTATNLYEITGPVNFDTYFRISPADGSGQIPSGFITSNSPNPKDLWVQSKKHKLILLPTNVSHVKVYTLSGTKLYSGIIEKQSLELDVQPGIYLISKLEKGQQISTKIRVP